MLNGFCRSGSDGGFWPDSRYSSLRVRAKLYPLEWWNQPPTSPPEQASQSQEVLSLSTGTSGFGSLGAIETEEISGEYNLPYDFFIVPSHDVAVFEIVMYVSYQLSDGSIEADFSSGDFRVLCPGVTVAIVPEVQPSELTV